MSMSAIIALPPSYFPTDGVGGRHSVRETRMWSGRREPLWVTMQAYLGDALSGPGQATAALVDAPRAGPGRAELPERR
jgi:hypothetical protein